MGVRKGREGGREKEREMNERKKREGWEGEKEEEEDRRSPPWFLKVGAYGQKNTFLPFALWIHLVYVIRRANELYTATSGNRPKPNLFVLFIFIGRIEAYE